MYSVDTRLERIKALVVDDDDVDRERLVRLLKRCRKDIEIAEVPTKRMALEELRKEQSAFSFIFLDFKLGDGDGRELLPEIWTSMGADCLVVAVTGYGSEHEAADAVRLGIHGYMSKGDLSADHVASAVEDGIRRIEINRHVRLTEADLRHRSTHDALTDLPNRHVFFDRLEQRCALYRREAAPFAVMMIDLDKFKQVNDELGHAVGDRLLIEAASRFKSVVRETDTVARLGGDEFAVILSNINAPDAAQAAHAVATQLVVELRRTFSVDEVAVTVGASVGVALCPQHGNIPETLLRRADDAMYRGKRSLDKVHLYSDLEPKSTSFLDRMVLLGEVEQALGRGDIQWYWQPKVNLQTRKVDGFEALARWSHRVHGMVPTDVFIEAIEASPLILQFALATVDDVIRQIGALGPALDGIRVAFNVSARVLEHATFVDELIERLDRSCIDPRRIVLELTETALIGSPAKAKRVIDRLAMHGLSLSIDDFGAGFTSFGYLRDFHVSEIKIDKSYILTLTENQFDRSLVSCLAVFCDSQGISLVAEGVETAQCWQMLVELGCRHGQGYGIGRPMPVQDVAGWLTAWNAAAEG